MPRKSKSQKVCRRCQQKVCCKPDQTTLYPNPTTINTITTALEDFNQDRDARAAEANQILGQRSLRIAIPLVILLFIVIFSIGIAGFDYFYGLGPVDAIHNTSMYLSGMGPIAEAKTTPQKLFVSVYAIIAGFLFIAIAAYLVDEVVDVLLFPGRNQ